MTNFTLFEVHVGSMSATANLPFSGAGSDSGSDEETTAEQTEESDEAADENDRKAVVLLGVLAVLVAVAAVVKRLSGDDEPDVEIDTPDEPVDVPVGSDE
jgi:hypothetical protein